MDEKMADMAHHNYRAHQRGCCETLIRYADVGSEAYYDARMRNISASGIYFEAEHNSLRKGTEIRVRVSHVPPDAVASDLSDDDHLAEVIWCREIAKEGSVCYGVGARFMIRRCDHCGGKFPHRRLHRTDEFLVLCSDCLEQLKTLPDGELRGHVENYLMGNVI